jgi:hypothetical protein
MANKYGKNGEAVAAFLDEVSATDLSEWKAFLELESPSREYSAAVRAAYAVPMSASVRTAVTSACQRTVRGLGLSSLGRGITRISTRVDGGAMGLAVRDTLTPEQLRVILAPFVALRFRSVADPATAPTEH